MSEFKKYKRKSKTNEAVRFTEENKDRIFNEMTGQVVADTEKGEPVLRVTTLHGDIATIRVGDWIIKDATLGTYYPCKSEMFDRDNEEV